MVAATAQTSNEETRRRAAWRLALRLPLACVLAVVVTLLAAGTAGCWKRETLVERALKDKVLHRSVGAEPEDLDPHFAVQAADYHVLSALFEGLVAEDPVDLRPVPGVAEHWEMSQDGCVFTFTLRADARWSDGSVVTAGDFVASFRRALSPTLGAKAAPRLHILRGARAYNRGETTDFGTVGAEARGARTLVLTLERPCASFLSMLAQPVWYPVNVKAIERLGPADRRGTAWARPGRMVGNGPFTLAEWSVNHRIVAHRSASYWDAARVSLREIHFYPMTPDTEERAFRAGQLHVTDALPPGRAAHHAAASPSPLRTDPLLGTYFYRLNTRIPALSDARVRRALGLAIDREAIIRRILQGGQAPAPAFTPPGIAEYTPPALFRHDPELARRLLAEAGHPGGVALPPIEILFNSSDTHRAVAEALQEMWRKELGVQVTLSNMEQASVLAARARGAFQVLRSSWTADYADPENFLDLWTTGAPDNCTGWSDAEYDALLAMAAGEREPARRRQLLAQAEQRLLMAAPVIPIYHYTHLYLLHPSVRGWHPTTLDHHPYKHVRIEP